MPCGEVVGVAVERMEGVVVEVEAVVAAEEGELGADAAGAGAVVLGAALMVAGCAVVVAGAAAVLGTALAGAGCETVAAGLTEGVVRGGAIAVEAVLAAEGSTTRALACSVESDGASRSSSCLAIGAGLAGLIRPPGLAFSDRRRIRGFSSVGWTKLNSPGATAEEGLAAGIGFSGMTP